MSPAPRIAHAAVALAVALSACTWETDLPHDAKSIPVDRSRELAIVDDAVLAPLSRNAGDAPLSFRRAIEGLALPDGATLRWLAAWSRRLRDDGEPARADAFDAKVTCAWLARAPENRCDAACNCAATSLPLDAAPFRLVAITNRTDLSVMPDRAADGGEGRLVFALTDGAADDAASPPLPMTVIVEYAQVGAALDWAKRWHALGNATDFSGALVALTRTFVAAGTLAQLRTADALTGSLLLHQFERYGGDLVAARVRNSPDWATVSESDVAAFAQANDAAIAAGTHLLPRAWWAARASTEAPPSWVGTLPEHDALVLGTCGGCHAKTDSGFQIDPLAVGDRRLSRFLLDPSNEQDELARRADWMRMTLWRGR